MTIAAERGKSVFRRTEKELLRLSSEHRAEAVHGFRTTTRRLQTLLGPLATGGQEKNKKLLKMLNRIRKSAGRVRDIDVQLDALRSLKVPQEPRRKTQLMQNLLDLRAQHENKLRKLLKKGDIREIRKRLKRAEQALRLESCSDPLRVARRMLASANLGSGVIDAEKLHRYRILVKRARYAAEFAPKSAESTKFLAELKRMQDALGNWHDWLTLTHTAVERLGDVSESSLVAMLSNLTRGKFRHALAAVSAARTQDSGSPAKSEKAPSIRKPGSKTKLADRQSSAAA